MNILEIYGGWLGLLLYFLYKDVWPIIVRKVIPAQIKEIESEREFHREMERERLVETRKMATAVTELSIYMSQTNERIAGVLSNQQLIITRQDIQANSMNEAIADMRVVVGSPARAYRRKEDKKVEVKNE